MAPPAARRAGRARPRPQPAPRRPRGAGTGGAAATATARRAGRARPRPQPAPRRPRVATATTRSARSRSTGAEAPPRRDGDDAVGARLRRDAARDAAAPATAGAAAKAPAVFDGRAIPFVLRRLHAFVTAPAPGGGATVVRCFIERTRSGAHALFPLYKLYADHEDGTGRLLLAARKVPAASPYYAISTAASDAAWNSTSESGYPEKYCGDLGEPPRHRTDAVAATPPRRRRGAPEI